MANYEDTQIGEVTTQAARDMELIRQDVERKDWPSVISGVKYQINAFNELLTALEQLQANGHLRSNHARS